LHSLLQMFRSAATMFVENRQQNSLTQRRLCFYSWAIGLECHLSWLWFFEIFLSLHRRTLGSRTIFFQILIQSALLHIFTSPWHYTASAVKAVSLNSPRIHRSRCNFLNNEYRRNCKAQEVCPKYFLYINCYSLRGRAIAQAVSRCLPTTAARVRARVWSSGICCGQSGAGAGFLRVLRFPLPIFIPPNSPSSQSPGAGTIGHSVTDVPSGPSLDSTPHYAN
jgi:hypothetical protein